MQKVLISLLILVTIISCSKDEEFETPGITPTQTQIPVIKDTVSYSKDAGSNVLAGKWYIGPFTVFCASDTALFYPNRNGNYIEFKNNDTAYSTYVTDGSFGWSPYHMINKD